jgi:hypothetical protein
MENRVGNRRKHRISYPVSHNAPATASPPGPIPLIQRDRMHDLILPSICVSACIAPPSTFRVNAGSLLWDNLRRSPPRRRRRVTASSEHLEMRDGQPAGGAKGFKLPVVQDVRSRMRCASHSASGKRRGIRLQSAPTSACSIWVWASQDRNANRIGHTHTVVSVRPA